MGNKSTEDLLSVGAIKGQQLKLVIKNRAHAGVSGADEELQTKTVK